MQVVLVTLRVTHRSALNSSPSYPMHDFAASSSRHVGATGIVTLSPAMAALPSTPGSESEIETMGDRLSTGRCLCPSMVAACAQIWSVDGASPLMPSWPGSEGGSRMVEIASGPVSCVGKSGERSSSITS
eukprot:3521100-Rhodomonas_salina.1